VLEKLYQINYLLKGVFMFDKIRPLGDRVLVKRLPTEEKTVSGLFIPEAAKEKAQMGAVMAVGSGRKDRDGRLIPVDVQINDIIVFGKYAGTGADFGNYAGIEAFDDEFLIIKEDEILCVVQK
jgi:chaperonin GroES